MTQESCPYLIIKNDLNRQALFYPHLPAFIIGRDSRCQVRLSDPSAAASHAVIHRRPNGCIVVAYAATQVNGREIREPHALNPGDVIKIGSALLEFRSDDLYDSTFAPLVVEPPIRRTTEPRNVASIAPPIRVKDSAEASKIYYPSQRVETLPGRPLWLLLYSLALFVTGAAWIYVLLIRYSQQTIEVIYGDLTIGIALLVAGVFAVLTAYGAYRMTIWGWRSAILACIAWIAGSVLLWIRAFNVMPVSDHGILIVATILGLTTFIAFDTIIQVAAGASFGDMIGDPADTIASKAGAPIGGRRIVGSYVVAGSFGVVGVALVVPLIIAAFAIVGDHIVVSGLVLDPDALSSLIPIEQGLTMTILVGGIAIHILLLLLLNLERARFGKNSPSQG